MAGRPAQRKVPRRNLSGVLLLDKPAGISSNGALQRVRFVFGAEKGGHTGNLDVAATGLLPICFGEATKTSAWLLDSDKTYIADIALGVTTASGDAEGEVLSRMPVTANMLAEIPTTLSRFIGAQTQIPPMYSALKRDGRPLYELARAGIEVERNARAIEIKKLQIVALEGATLRVEVKCTKGTYIRVLAEDIGAALGCGASLCGLRRTAAGPYALERAVPLDLFGTTDWPTAEFDNLLLPIDSALKGMPAIAVSTPSAARLRRGQSLNLSRGYPPGPIRIYRADGQFVGLGEAATDQQLLPRRLIRYDECSQTS